MTDVRTGSSRTSACQIFLFHGAEKCFHPALMTRLLLLKEFLAAVTAAARHSKKWPGFGLVKAALLIFGIGKKVDWDVYQQRARACAGCPNMNATTNTCGTPPSEYGCWCYMPVKAMLPEANCWLYETNPDHPDHIGWPKHLNGTPWQAKKNET